jgi:hypothetical protein
MKAQTSKCPELTFNPSKCLIKGFTPPFAWFDILGQSRKVLLVCE